MSFITLLLVSCNNTSSNMTYPKTEKGNTETDYFGTKVKDPYRWLEDDNSKATKTWVDEQIKTTQTFLSKIPFRGKIKKRFEELMKYPSESAPFKKGNFYFTYKNNGEQNQSVLYMKKEIDGDDVEVLNPNTLSKEGIISLAGFSLSADSKYMAYITSKGGSDWRQVSIKDLDTKIDLKDKIDWVKFSGIAWYKDGFYYARYPKPKKGDDLKGANENCKIYYHKLKTSQSEDNLVFELPENPDWGMGVSIEKKSNFLIINLSNSTYGNRIFIKDLITEEVFKLVDNFEKEYSIIKEENGKLLVITDDNAQNRKLISIDIRTNKREDIIQEKEYVLRTCSIYKDKIIAQYIKDAHSKIEIFDRDGQYLYDVDLPQKIATVTGFKISKDDDFTFYSLNSFTARGDIYKYNISNNTSELYKKSEIKFDNTNYTTKQVFYTSKDGTKVPMFITHKKGIKLDGKRPTLLYAYGGFNISITPRFNSAGILFIENGGIYVSANLRGGGEYGDEWHKSGTKMNKQNVFDDFISAAEYLIANKYTNPNKLSINGGSNGGLLMGAVTNQRPDLFKVAITQVGVLDMLRYQLFTIGRYWATDYGTSEDSKEMFEYLYKYSPLHNVKSSTKYPAIMVTTGDHDDRVVPAHSFKYIATVQDKNKSDNPTIIRIDKNAGHGSGKPISKSIEEYTDIVSFIFYNLGVEM